MEISFAQKIKSPPGINDIFNRNVPSSNTSFFVSLDRNDSIDHEYVDVCVKTNYAGYVYWGEYSLVFAAVLNQEECFRLILSRGMYC